MLFFFFSGQEGRKGWWASYTCLGRGVGGRLLVYWINTVICLSLDCHLNKVNVTWCTDDDDDDDDDQLSVNWRWQPTSCMFHCNIVSGQNVHCWGTLAAESYIIMSHTTNKAIISKHHNDYYTLQTLELTGKTWCVQHVHQLWAFTLS